MRVSLLFLGTGAPDAGSDDMPAVLLRAGSSFLLLDAGEGVQHKLAKVGVGLSKVGYVMVTHLHGDHVLGLVPLIQSRALMSRPTPQMSVFGPPGLKKLLDESFSSLYFDPGSSLEVQELRGGEEVRVRDVTARAEPLDHTVPTVGYLIAIPGGSGVCYVTDTRPLTEGFRGVGCDILIHDSTFSWMDLGKAVEFKHSTALEAALFASSIKAKILFLYHISSRYKDRGLLEREARRVHPHTYAASKYMALTV